MCGSLANADPASEWSLTAVTLDAELIVRNKNAERAVKAGTFFKGVMSTEMKEDDLLVEVRFPVLPGDTRFGFREFSRRAGDFALAASLVTYRIENGLMRNVRVGVGGAEPVPRRLAAAEVELEDRPARPATFRRAARAAGEVVEPMEDHQIDARYRRGLVEAIVQCALEQTL
jgi:carbon-monoxide dehydrogenase medium subunit